MKIAAIISILTLGLALQAFPAMAEQSGREILLEHQCNKCHGISTQGIEMTDLEEEIRNAPDLSDVGTSRDQKFLRGFLKKKISVLYKGYHDRKFRGSDEEFAVLVDWLLTLKDQPGKEGLAMK